MELALQVREQFDPACTSTAVPFVEIKPGTVANPSHPHEFCILLAAGNCRDSRPIDSRSHQCGCAAGDAGDDWALA